MSTEEFRDIINDDLMKRMDFIRKMGNNAAHSGKKITEDQAILCLENLRKRQMSDPVNSQTGFAFSAREIRCTCKAAYCADTNFIFEHRPGFAGSKTETSKS